MYRDKALEDKMLLVREIVSLSHSARNDAKIKIRQPLKKVVAVINEADRIKGVQEFEKLILEEINMHQLEFVSNSDELQAVIAEPDFKNLGPKFGADVNKIAVKIRELSIDQISQLKEGHELSLKIDDSRLGKITIDDINLKSVAAPGMVVQTGKSLTIAIDTQLDDNLISEGLVREVINRIQKMRKEAGLEVVDRINVYYNAAEKLEAVIIQHDKHIRDEILAVEMINKFQEGSFNKEWKIDEFSISIGIEKAV
jgi:isoleucyl-tRNA synthetase